MAHQYDPNRLPDSEFVPGELDHLVPGNRGRLLDPRRTPVRVVAIEPELGQFLIAIETFEDEGASWTIALEEVGHFQFRRGQARATPAEIVRYHGAVTRFDRASDIACDAAVATATRDRLASLRAELLGRDRS